MRPQNRWRRSGFLAPPLAAISIYKRRRPAAARRSKALGAM
jgi:hypothetical protein